MYKKRDSTKYCLFSGWARRKELPAAFGKNNPFRLLSKGDCEVASVPKASELSLHIEYSSYTQNATIPPTLGRI